MHNSKCPSSCHKL